MAHKDRWRPPLDHETGNCKICKLPQQSFTEPKSQDDLELERLLSDFMGQPLMVMVRESGTCLCDMED